MYIGSLLNTTSPWNNVSFDKDDGTGGGNDDGGADDKNKKVDDNDGGTDDNDDGGVDDKDDNKKKKKNVGNETEAQLLAELMKEKKKRKDTEARLAEFDGIDPKSIKDLIADAAKRKKDKEDADRDAAEKAGDFERAKKMMADSHAAEIKKVNDENDELKRQLGIAKKDVDDLTIGAAFSNSPFITDDLVLSSDIARSVFGEYCEREDGRIVFYDKPRNSKERTKLVAGDGDPLGFDDAVRKLVEGRSDKDKLLRSKMKQGANSKTTDTKKKPGSDRVSGTGIDRISAALAAGALKEKAKA